MNKTDLVSKIAADADISTDKAEQVLNATLNGILETLISGDSVNLTGFGKFGVKARAARKVRNPKTGQEMMTKAATVPFFKAGKGLKEMVDSKK